MKILSAQQIRELDACTIAAEPIASIDLMERAATACYKWISKYGGSEATYIVFCGTGNNGGDGLAIARLLHQNDHVVECYIVRSGNTTSAEAQTNELRLQDIPNVRCRDIRGPEDIPVIPADAVVIDALLGTGINKPVAGLLAQVISTINGSPATVIAVDMPSGLFADKASAAGQNPVIRASYTLSFELPKLAFFFAENAAFVGEVFLLPIGLDKSCLAASKSAYHLAEEKDIAAILKKRTAFSHKGNYGHAAIIAGSFGKMGAAVLASKACLTTGAGLLTVNIPASGYDIMQVALPEAIVVCDANKERITSGIDSAAFNAIGIGPGLGTATETTDVLEQLLKKVNYPVVIDADAINIIAQNKSLFENIPPQSILTPHPKEFERLAGVTQDQLKRNQLQIELSVRYNVFIILKGRFTAISCPDGSVYFNPTGNPGMAKGGSGDTLTGMLTGLLAQGYSPKEACIAGVYLHGLAADIAVKETSEYALLASDIIEHIGKAILSITNSK